MTPLEQQYDIVVVGSGGAGSAAAETAAAEGRRVLLVSKDPITCSDSKISEGIVTVRASGSERDTPDELANNLRIQGDDLGEPALAQRFAQDSQSAYEWLRANGLHSRTDPETGRPIPLSIPMGGHSLARSVDHANGGLDYGHACWNAVTRGQLDYLEDAWFLDLYTDQDTASGDRSVHGGLIYHAITGDFISVAAKSVVLACGGVSTLYFPHTDTMKGNTGDAYAIAARAGAQLVDMEQVQFIPFAITHPPSYEGLVVGEPIIAGVLGCIRDREGNRLKGEIMGRTRAECAAVIARAVADGRGTVRDACYLDLTANRTGRAGEAYLALMQEKIPGILKIVRGAMNPRAARFEEPWEVRPSAHYLMGGVRASADCEALDHRGKPIAGLYVAGQAMGGLHGSNRLGSTSLAEGIVFGRRAGRAAARSAEKRRPSAPFDRQAIIDLYGSVLGQTGTVSPINLLRRLQSASWKGMGPGRTGSGLEEALQLIHACGKELDQAAVDSDPLWNQAFIDWVETRNLLYCAESMARCALARPESIGAHVRLDAKGRSRLRLSPFSTAVYGDPGSMVVTRLRRPPSPLWPSLKLHLKQSARIGLFKFIARLPGRWRDAVLYRIYTRALGREPDSGADKAPTPVKQDRTAEGIRS